jgi:hypothetical protein
MPYTDPKSALVPGQAYKIHSDTNTAQHSEMGLYVEMERQLAAVGLPRVGDTDVSFGARQRRQTMPASSTETTTGFPLHISPLLTGLRLPAPQIN